MENIFVHIFTKMISHSSFGIKHVIIIGKIFNFASIKSVVQQKFTDIPIHHFTTEDITKGACQRALEIHNFSQKENVDIEYDVKFKY